MAASFSTDDLFSKPLSQLVDFSFDQNVAAVFPDMIKRSVPGYTTLVNLIAGIVSDYIQPDTNCYDLGCSLGAVSLAICSKTENKAFKLIAVDNSSSMLMQAKTFFSQQPALETQLSFVEQDILCTDIDNASVVILNFTLQFIAPKERDALIERIYRGLRSGGILIISEKVHFEDGMLQQLHTELHHAFKKHNGYSDLEISQKRQAIENVLVTDSLDVHTQRLLRAGFQQVIPWFQCFNFLSVMAIK